MKISFTILGCGSSIGLPTIDGSFGKCDPKNKKNYRTRCSALISIGNINYLIDTSPDIKNQLLKKKIKNIDKLYYTHSHADQVHGINELRVFYIRKNKRISVFADRNTKKHLLNNFSYCFNGKDNYPAFLKMNSLKRIYNLSIANKKISIRSVIVKHGKINSICYIINKKCAYAPDVSKIYKKDLKYFKKLNYLVVDCLRYKAHPSHFNLKDILNLVRIVKPKKTILTNLNYEIDYSYIKKLLPKNVLPAYDGMTFSI